MNRIASLSLLLVCAYAHARDATVDLTLPAMDLERAVARVAESTGSKLSVAPALRREIVVLRVKGVLPNDLLSRLAEVTDAIWSDRPDGERQLIPKARPRTDDALRARAKSLSETIQRMLRPRPKESAPVKDKEESVETAAPPAQEEPEFGYMLSGPSGTRTILRLAATIDPMQLANLDPYGRTVYSNRPTRAQRPLIGPTVPGVLAEWVRDHNASVGKQEQAERADSTRAKTPDEVAAEEAMAQFGGLFGQAGKPRRIEDGAKVVLVVHQGLPFNFMNDSTGAMTFELRAYDATGAIVATGMTIIRLPGATIRQSIERESKPLEGKPIEFSPISREFAKLIDWSDAENFGQTDPSSALAERLMRPDLYDPLSFTHSEALLGTAEARGAALVACLPDSVMLSLDFGVPGSPTSADAVFDRVSRDGTLTASEQDGWWTIKPADPAAARTGRLDRAALATLLRAASSKPVVALDDLAAYAVVNPMPGAGSVAMPYLFTYVSGAMRLMISENDWQMLRLYGMLGPSTRQSLAQGIPTPLVALGPNALEFVRRMTYGASARLDVRRPDAATRSGWMQMIAEFLPSPPKDYLDEPTEALPNGIPPDAVIEMTTTTEPIALPLNDKGTPHRLFGALSANDMAMIRASEEMDTDMTAGMIKRVKMGKQFKLQLRVRLSPVVGLKAELRDPSVDADAPAIDATKLPAEFEKLVSERVKAFKDNPFAQFMNADPSRPRP